MKATRVIAVLNQKGGVGKTTLTAHLGHALALAGRRVTLIDLDPQGQLSASLGVHEAPLSGADVLLHGRALPAALVDVREGLRLLPGTHALQQVERLSQGGAARGRLLVNALGQEPGAEFVLIDCPPAAGILATNALFAANEVLIPITADYLALQGLSALLQTLESVQNRIHTQLQRWITLSRICVRRRLTVEVLDILRRRSPGRVLRTPIREAAVLAECPGHGRTVFELRANSRSANELTQLADDFVMGRTL